MTAAAASRRPSSCGTGFSISLNTRRGPPHNSRRSSGASTELEERPHLRRSAASPEVALHGTDAVPFDCSATEAAHGCGIVVPQQLIAGRLRAPAGGRLMELPLSQQGHLRREGNAAEQLRHAVVLLAVPVELAFAMERLRCLGFRGRANLTATCILGD